VIVSSNCGPEGLFARCADWGAGRAGSADALPDEALSVLTAYPADQMEAFAVSTAVNRAGRDAPEMAEALSG
jgi:hypothetical protein